MKYFLEKKDKTVEKIINATFPDYKGRQIKISTNIPLQLDSYWGNGSKKAYAFYELATGKVLLVEENHPHFETDKPHMLGKLPEGVVLVNHDIFCGEDRGITIFAEESSLVPLLPDLSENQLSYDEITVLKFTDSYKSSYRGIKNLRFYEANRKIGITHNKWDAAKQKLMNKKFLTKRGALMPKGRNYLSSYNLI